VGAGGGTCTAAGAGNISDTVNLPAGGSVTYTASCTISAAATGTLSNTATVAPPAGVTDPNPASNSATDSDTLNPPPGAAVSGTKTVSGTFTVGGTVTYTVVLINSGTAAQANNPGDEFVDVLPGTLSLVSAAATSGTAVATVATNTVTWNGSIPAGGSVTITINATILPAGAGATISNQGTVAFDGDGNGTNETTALTDDPGQPGAADPTSLTVASVQADLSITKTDGVTTATPGGSVTYTIVASNAGPGGATGATVADTFPASLTCSWTCAGAGGGTCTAAGSGNINDTVNLPSGGGVTYTAACTIAAGATGTLSNTATVAAPAGVTDPDPANNSATDSDTLVPQADLAITKTDGVTTATSGGSVTYTIVASNAGPGGATGATVADTFPASLTCTWTCAGAGGGTCAAAGSGNINDTVNLPSGGSVTYTAACTIAAGATGTLSNTATVVTPAGATDPNPANNSATDTDTLAPPPGAAVSGTKTVSGTFTVGGAVTYTVILTNSGTAAQADNPGDEFVDVLPATLSLVSATATSGTAVATVATNTVTWNGAIPAGGSVTITINATILPAGTGTTIANQGTIAFDGDGNGANERTAQTDDPGQPGAADPTGLVVTAAAIPTLSTLGWLVLALVLTILALGFLRGRRVA
jgi:uncharacterized repeat protein (TIGR01451 family)